MAKSPEQLAHEQWLGYIQPNGLVVSIPALLEARAHINQNFLPRHRALLEFLPKDRTGTPLGELPGFLPFATAILGWAESDIAGAPQGPPLPESVQFYLRDYGEMLRPKYAVRDFTQPDSAWLLLIDELPGDQDFDTPAEGSQRQWQASPQARFERLLRETQVPAGLLVNRQAIRLVYAPRTESSGFLTFRIPEMVQVAGRPLFAALDMLLSADRLFNVEKKEQLPAILAASRRYQNVVSTRLAGQVMAALYELLRGFQSAHDQSAAHLLKDVLASDPNQVYEGLLTVLLRLVFILFAEDRGLLSTDPVYTNHYGIGGLFERLRADAARYPDTMDQRFGAWAQLLTLFRLIYDGGSHGPQFDLPARRGYLFDPARYPFLEGRQSADDPVSIPRISDGVLHRVLENLLILDGERLSYRNLDVEQIGSVYEAVMGFTLQVAEGPSIAITSPKKSKGGAPATIDLDKLLRTSPAKRAEWLLQSTGQKLAPKVAAALKSAGSILDLLAALDRKVEKDLTPAVVPPGSMTFQPSPERRRSGSHYTPRSLTSPIVEAALAPVLQQLGPAPTPEQILDLKICDPAMGSGAFLVEACRQLGEHLLEAWRRSDSLPPIPPDEDEWLYARRAIAQRCLYGVDRNEMAVDLAKLSLWLATLAKDHPFTFLDHALRHGDSLVGFTTRQISYFDWSGNPQLDLFGKRFQDRLELALRNRAVILNAPDFIPYETQQQRLRKAEEPLTYPRLSGDLLAAAFFSSSKPRQRDEDRQANGVLLKRALEKITDLETEDEIQRRVQALRAKGVFPFHWEIEFPEVFQRGGFDVIVGNPPFAGKNTITEGNPEGYLDWLKQVHAESHGNSDLAAHFFRRAFFLLKVGGCFGLIATNTIGQGDTRSTGLRSICANGGVIYRARKRYKWPGQAAVVVSIVHVHKGPLAGPYHLDGRAVDRITAYLFHAGGSEDPEALAANEGKSFIGSYVLGMGFTFDDTDTKGVASSLADMHRLIEKDPRNAERIFPYIGGEEVNDSPTHAHHRFVINFEDFPLRRKDTGHSWFRLTEETQKAQLREGIVAPDYPNPVAADWPDLLAIVEERVKPVRAQDKRENYRDRWWQFAERRPGLAKTLRHRELVIARSLTSTRYVFAMIPARMVHDQTLIVFCMSTFSEWALLSCRVHEVWAQFFGATFKDDSRYNVRDCFETFPFPAGLASGTEFENKCKEQYEQRTALMLQANQGLTKISNRVHDPGETSREIVELRRMESDIDIAVLKAYGWMDLNSQCDFFPEFDEEDEDPESSRKKKRFRYRWPDEIRDEVLARLLALNRDRYGEEVLAGLHGKAGESSRALRRTAVAGEDFGPMPDELDLQGKLNL